MKILFLSFFLIPFQYVISQGNLQFNTVYTYSGFMNTGTQTPTLTVPNGKFWKIDHFTSTWLVINNNKADNTANNGGPVWLKSGDIIFYSAPFYNACCGGTSNYLISIIEYNIIP